MAHGSTETPIDRQNAADFRRRQQRSARRPSTTSRWPRRWAAKRCSGCDCSSTTMFGDGRGTRMRGLPTRSVSRVSAREPCGKPAFAAWCSNSRPGGLQSRAINNIFYLDRTVAVFALAQRTSALKAASCISATVEMSTRTPLGRVRSAEPSGVLAVPCGPAPIRAYYDTINRLDFRLFIIAEQPTTT